jgi:hypothetical protein
MMSVDVVVSDSDAYVLMDVTNAVEPVAMIVIVHVPWTVFREQMTLAAAVGSD